MKIRYYFLTLLISVSLFSCNSQPKTSSELDLHYKSKDGTVEYDYNANWEIEESEEPNVKAMIFSTKEKDYENFRENINLIGVPKDPSLSFDKFITGSKNYLKLNNLKVVEEEITEINNHKAYKVVFDQNYEGDSYRLLQFQQLINNVGYTFTFVGTQEKYAKYAPEAEQIIRSFKLK